MADTVCEGNVWKFGDKISTDLMVPGAYVLARRGITDEEAAQYCMRANRPDWAAQVQRGDILVGGVNFACGSSRNWARPIQVLGVSVVLAESISRIGLRNGINTGLPCLVCPGISKFVEEGERLQVDIVSGEVRNLTRGAAIQAQAWPQDSPPFQIMMAGGFERYFRQRLVEAGKIKPQVAAT
ncbi:MAG: 3-isopropylmalate dehydratase [Chloroflexi bacterium]|nr:3-isopropylmalate dehydratase [Chloroflexota bacterium]